MWQNCNIDAGHNTDYFLGTSGKAERREEDQADNPADRQATVTNHFISSKSALLAMLTELHRTSCLFSDCDSMPLPGTGASGVGKSSTTNYILAERVANVAALQSDTAKAQCFSRVAAGFTLSIIDTPGVLEGDAINGAVCVQPSHLQTQNCEKHSCVLQQLCCTG